MRKTHSLLQIATACSLLTGIMLVFGQAMGPMGAQLTGPGSAVQRAEERVEDPTLHAAAEIVQRAEAGRELAMGALFIILGFVLHALLRHRNERNVHITIRPSSRTCSQVRNPQKIDKGEWFWVHLHI